MGGFSGFVNPSRPLPGFRADIRRISAQSRSALPPLHSARVSSQLDLITKIHDDLGTPDLQARFHQALKPVFGMGSITDLSKALLLTDEAVRDVAATMNALVAQEKIDTDYLYAEIPDEDLYSVQKAQNLLDISPDLGLDSLATRAEAAIKNFSRYAFISPESPTLISIPSGDEEKALHLLITRAYNNLRPTDDIGTLMELDRGGDIGSLSLISVIDMVKCDEHLPHYPADISNRGSVISIDPAGAFAKKDLFGARIAGEDRILAMAEFLARNAAFCFLCDSEVGRAYITQGFYNFIKLSNILPPDALDPDERPYQYYLGMAFALAQSFTAILPEMHAGTNPALKDLFFERYAEIRPRLDDEIDLIPGMDEERKRLGSDLDNLYNMIMELLPEEERQRRGYPFEAVMTNMELECTLNRITEQTLKSIRESNDK